MPDENLKKLHYKNYLAMIEGSVGTNTFRHLYVGKKDTGEELDTMVDGEYSGAFFVSGVLTLMRYIARPHATVDSTIQDMEQSGWTKTNAPKQGDVILWDKDPTFNTENLGFYWDDREVVYNSYQDRVPVLRANPTDRAILSYWTRDFDRVLKEKTS